MVDLDIEDKDKLMESIKQQQEQQSEQQSKMAELQMQNQQIVNESLQSKALSDRSLAEERFNKGQLEQAAIITKFNESEHQKAGAMLDKVKAAKEIESMHIDDFVKVFSLIENMQKRQDETVVRQQEEQQKLQGALNGTQS